MRVLVVGMFVVLGLLALAPAQTASVASAELDQSEIHGQGCRTTLVLLLVWIMLLILMSVS